MLLWGGAAAPRPFPLCVEVLPPSSALSRGTRLAGGDASGAAAGLRWPAAESGPETRQRALRECWRRGGGASPFFPVFSAGVD